MRIQAVATREIDQSAGRLPSARQAWQNRRFWRFEGRPWWSIAGLAFVAILAAVLYTWALAHNGMGNEYYAAAVKSGTVSWKAFFFGALDPGSFITVDKLPASFWMAELSARIFGFSSWSILLPQALAGVGSVLILYRLVRRWQGEAAGLLAALAFALTPIALVIFRFNNPDAMLTLLLLGGAWALWSALESGSTWKLAGAGALIGFAFLTKMLEALVVLPAFVLVYLVCGPRSLGRRLLQAVAAGGALVAAGGWWVAVVELWPKASRPFIGGSTTNSVLDLVFSRSAGYLSSGSSGGGSMNGGASFGGSAGWLRMFNSQIGGQISWLIPLAFLGLLGGLWFTRRGGRRDPGRAGYLMWGMWMLLTLGVFSFANGVLHPYYTVLAAPGIAALVGGGSVALWRLGRQSRWFSWVLPAGVLGTAAWSAVLLWRTQGYAPGLAPAILAGGAVAAIALCLVLALGNRRTTSDVELSVRRRVLRPRYMLQYVAVGAALFAVLAGPMAYNVSSISRSVTGSFAAAGPAVTQNQGGPGSNRQFASLSSTAQYYVATSSSAGSSSAGSSSAGSSSESTSNQSYGPPSGGAPSGGSAPSGSFGGGAGGGNTTVDQALITFLEQHRGTAKFLVAVEGANAAEPIILASGEPVIAMGGFSGSDPAPTLDEFKAMVAAGEVHYVLVGGGGMGGGRGGTTSTIAQWVEANGTAVSSDEYSGTASGTLYYVG